MSPSGNSVRCSARLRHGVQEVALVLGAIAALVETRDAGGVTLDARVMAGRNLLGAEPLRSTRGKRRT